MAILATIFPDNVNDLLAKLKAQQMTINTLRAEKEHYKEKYQKMRVARNGLKCKYDKLVKAHRVAVKTQFVPKEGEVQKYRSGTIMGAVLQYFGLETLPEVGATRKRELIYPRHIYTYLMARYSTADLHGVARLLGYADHTTPIYIRNQIQFSYDKGLDGVREDVDAIMANIQRKDDNYIRYTRWELGISPKKPVEQWVDGEWVSYDSVKAAQLATGLSNRTIRNVLDGKTKISKKAGLWRYKK